MVHCESLKDVARHVWACSKAGRDVEIQYRNYKPVKVKYYTNENGVHDAWVYDMRCGMGHQIWAWNEHDKTPLQIGMACGVCERAEDFMVSERPKIRL